MLDIKGITKEDLLNHMYDLVPPETLSAYLQQCVTEDNVVYLAESIRLMNTPDADGFYHTCRAFLLYQELISFSELVIIPDADIFKLVLLFFGMFSIDGDSNFDWVELNWPLKDRVADNLVQVYYADKTKNSYATLTNLTSEVHRYMKPLGDILDSNIFTDGTTMFNDDTYQWHFAFIRINKDSSYAEKHIRIFSYLLNGYHSGFWKYIQLVVRPNCNKMKATVNYGPDQFIYTIDTEFLNKYFPFKNVDYTDLIKQLVEYSCKKTINYKLKVV